LYSLAIASNFLLQYRPWRTTAFEEKTVFQYLNIYYAPPPPTIIAHKKYLRYNPYIGILRMINKFLGVKIVSLVFYRGQDQMNTYQRFLGWFSFSRKRRYKLTKQWLFVLLIYINEWIYCIHFISYKILGSWPPLNFMGPILHNDWNFNLVWWTDYMSKLSLEWAFDILNFSFHMLKPGSHKQCKCQCKHKE